MPYLSKQQRENAEQIIRIGQEEGMSDASIRTAVKIAYIESSLGTNKGKNPHSSAKGMYQYIDASWRERHSGERNNNEDSIRAYYKDLKRYEREYEESNRLRQKNPEVYEKQPLRKKFPESITLEEYAYVKHHDGPNAGGDERYVKDGNMGRGINIFDKRNREGAEDVANEVFQPQLRQDNHLPDASQNPSSTAPDQHSSIFDSFDDTIGAASSAIATVGSVAFNAAMNLGDDSLRYTVTQALTQGGNGQGTVANAARAVMGQALARMHGLVMQAAERQAGGARQLPGADGPIPIRAPDPTTQDAIERTINDPRNAGIFDRLARQMGVTLEQVEGTEPASALASQVVNVLRRGEIKVQPHILVPDLLPQEDGPMRTPTGDERVIELGGLAVPIRLPEIRLPDGSVIGESGIVLTTVPDASGGNFGGNTGVGPLQRGGDGTVQVASYTRGDGTRVAAHSRTRPDDSVANNLSFKRGK
jgi:hypothetical protein